MTTAARVLPGERMLPGFLIAGAQRCGTTSLFRMLAEHPQVRPPALTKGIHFFDTAGKYRRGLDFYAAHFPRAATNRDEGVMTGEASPYYVFHPLAAARIAKDLPNAKLIVLLRDPVERAYSAYKQETGRGFESLSFPEALAQENERLAGEEDRMISDPEYQSFAHQHHAYVARGQYAPQLERLFAAVGRDRVLVQDETDFFSPGLPMWDGMLDFLGLAPWRPAQAVRANARPSAPLSEDIRSQLEGRFDASDARLADLLGRAPSWYRHTGR